MSVSTTMPFISGVIVAKNEQDTIVRALKSMSEIADEIILVDTGSIDKTIDLAKDEGAIIKHFEWIDDFSAAFNYAFSVCTGEWVFYLHADDYIDEQNINKIIGLKNKLFNYDKYDLIYFSYEYLYDSAGNPLKTLLRPNITRKCANLKWQGVVHERLVADLQKALILSDIKIMHKPTQMQIDRKENRNIEILKKHINKDPHDVYLNYFYGKELINSGQYSQALTILSNIVESVPTVTDKYVTLLCMAECAVETNEMNLAIHYCLKAITVQPERAEAYGKVGLIYYYQSLYKVAIPFFTLAKDMHRPVGASHIDEPYYTWLPYFYLSDCYGNIGDFQKAVKYGTQALQLCVNKDWLKEKLTVWLSMIEYGLSQADLPV